jgi:cytochrome d ubiquinol oxidase subunit I
METRYAKTGNILYKKMAQFWGRLFLINAAVGIVTGIVQEFHFGMNWSEYSRFVGDVFGTPLAIETLLAFFLESTFLGIWIFGWERLNKFVHLACIWLVVLGSLMSAFWILVANSMMQNPVGYKIENGKAILTDFFALLTNPNLWVQFPHVLLASLLTGAFFVMGVSAFNILKKKGDTEFFRRSASLALVIAAVTSIGVAMAGDAQATHVAEANPMKLAAFEAHWNTEGPASESLISIVDEQNRKDIFSIKIPFVLSLLAHHDPNAEVQGINQLQAEAEQKYGPGNYVPPVMITYVAFRGMVGSGVLMILLSLFGLFLAWKRKLTSYKWFLRALVFAIPLPYIAAICGWVVAEVGRQPWVVNGVLKTEAAISPGVDITMVTISLATFIVLYLGLLAAHIFLLAKYAQGNTLYQLRNELEDEQQASSDDDKLLEGAY